MRVLVTGGCGYKGTILTQKLLEEGHEVTVIDTCWFGNYLQSHKRLTIIQEDVRHTERVPLKGVDVVLHLANIANDPSVELNPYLSWEVNVLATMRLADASVRNGVKQFIYASSGSVYGIKEEPKVTEDLELVPISEYNKTKMVAERVLLSYKDGMIIQIIRPATVCGYSPRMRLDLSVNMLTMQALTKGEITVFGGDQTRPNIHIQDITDLYLYLIEQGDRVQGTFNAGFENLSIVQIADKVAKRIPAKISVVESNDPRSYRMNSDKLLATGFKPKKTVDDAIEELSRYFADGLLGDKDQCYNVGWMKRHNLV